MASSGTALAALPWGEAVGVTAIAAGQTFKKTFGVTIDAGWNKDRLRAFAVIFKKNSAHVFEAVNVAEATGLTAAIADVKILNTLNIYPNPASELINIVLNASGPAVVDISISDAAGKMVYSRKGISISSGNNTLPVETGQLSKGNYFIAVSGKEAGKIGRSVVIGK